jgi:hypothetical protein
VVQNKSEPHPRQFVLADVDRDRGVAVTMLGDRLARGRSFDKNLQLVRRKPTS